MKLSIFKGLAYDLSDHLSFMIVSGELSKMVDFPINKNVLDKKDKFDEYCVKFFKDRIPKNFDFSRIKKIIIRIKRSAMLYSVKVEITVDDKVFSSSNSSL